MANGIGNATILAAVVVAMGPVCAALAIRMTLRARPDATLIEAAAALATVMRRRRPEENSSLAKAGSVMTTSNQVP